MGPVHAWDVLLGWRDRGWGGYMASVTAAPSGVSEKPHDFQTPGQMNGESPSSKEQTWTTQSPAWSKNFRRIYMGVSKNMGTTKSSILIGFSTINHPFWGTPNFWKHPYSRRFIYCKSLWLLKTHILMVQWKWNISPRCSFTQTRNFQLNQEEVTISLFFSFFLSFFSP